MNELVRNHRMMGYKIAESTDAQGQLFTLLQTSPREYSAAPSHMLLPVSDSERDFEARTTLMAAIERCAFLGVDLDALPALLHEEIAYFRNEQAHEGSRQQQRLSPRIAALAAQAEEQP